MVSKQSQALDDITKGFHAVVPKKDCPHCTDEHVAPKATFADVSVNSACSECGVSGECWVCLYPDCKQVRCSRYVNSHMVVHQRENPEHCVMFSFADFSFWCYKCDSYLEHQKLNHMMQFYEEKFGEKSQREVFQEMRESKHKEEITEENEDEDDEEEKKPAQAEQPPKEVGAEEEKKDDEEQKPSVSDIVKGMEELKVDEDSETFRYEDLVSGLKAGRFKKILVATGAGISVSAGIPDFRSPKTGIYANLKEYNLPQPEALFAIEYFLENPAPFYKFAQDFDMSKYNATPTHYFLKLLQDKGLMWKNFTQNIDNLEEKTGMNMDDVIQAHGANKGAHCARCKKEADPQALQQKIREGQVMYCESCTCPVKPDIVFFGEGLPPEFFETFYAVGNQPDLLLVMGTALAVSPFNMIPQMVAKKVPKVLFNMENTKETGGYDFADGTNKKLFVQGKCDENIRKLVADLGWSEEFEQVLPDVHKEQQAAQQE